MYVRSQYNTIFLSKSTLIILLSFTCMDCNSLYNAPVTLNAVLPTFIGIFITSHSPKTASRPLVKFAAVTFPAFGIKPHGNFKLLKIIVYYTLY